MTSTVDMNRPECSLCLNDLPLPYVSLACEHSFHDKCLTEQQLTHNDCPLCKRYIVIVKIDKDIQFVSELNLIISKLKRLSEETFTVHIGMRDQTQTCADSLRSYLAGLQEIKIINLACDPHTNIKSVLINMEALKILHSPIDRAIKDAELGMLAWQLKADLLSTYDAVEKFLELPNAYLQASKIWLNSLREGRVMT